MQISCNLSYVILVAKQHNDLITSKSKNYAY